MFPISENPRVQKIRQFRELLTIRIFRLDLPRAKNEQTFVSYFDDFGVKKNHRSRNRLDSQAVKHYTLI